MKAWMTRHAAPVCALLCLLLIAASGIALRLQADAGTYGIRHIEGDAAQLNGVRIDLRLEDSAHRQRIAIDSGVLSHSYEYLPSIANDRQIAYHGSQTFVEHEDARVRISVDKTLEYADESHESYLTRMTRAADLARVSVNLNRRDVASRSRRSDMQQVQVVTDVVAEDERYPFLFRLNGFLDVHKNQISQQGEPLPDQVSQSPLSDAGSEILDSKYPVERAGYGMLYCESADGTVYFTPSLRPYHGGKSAIYRVDEWNDDNGWISEPHALDGYEAYPMFTERPLGKATALATFPVDGHSLRTVSLDMAGDRLCLLLIVDGILTLRVYGTDGALLTETALFAYAPQYEVTTTLSANQSGGSTMLCYHLQDLGVYEQEAGLRQADGDILFCVELGETAALRSVLTGHPSLLRAGYVGGRWVLAESTPDPGMAKLNLSVAPVRTYLSVLSDEGETLYRGEIVTDAMEDSRQSWNPTGGGQQYAYSVYQTNRYLQCDAIGED